MTIRDFQEWTRRSNASTRWDAISPLQVLAHLTEELGEVAQSVNRIYEYRGETAEKHRQNLGVELMDVLGLLSQLACRYDVDLQREAEEMVSRADSRQPDAFRSQLIAGIETLASDASKAQLRLG
ncbi:MazG nucleotide pyrophosphohydrolase domain-containing protein [Candidatus Latescibacterota bacterium]